MKYIPLSALGLAAALSFTPVAMPPAMAASYVIDTDKAHASINFRVKHLGYSWLTGRFENFSGSFEFDEKDPAKSKVTVEIDTTSVSSNHAPRDKHLRSADFLNVDVHPTATFVSTGIELSGSDSAFIKGNLTLLGVTKPVEIKAKHVGGGDDPWGGFRQGFEGTVTFNMYDFGVQKSLGPASTDVEMTLHVEGIRQ